MRGTSITRRLTFVTALGVATVLACTPPLTIDEVRVVPDSIELLSSPDITAVVASTIVVPGRVRVKDQFGFALPGQAVAFSASAGTLASQTGITDSQGEVAVPSWQVPTVTALVTVSVSIPGSSVASAVFNAMLLPGPPSRMSIGNQPPSTIQSAAAFSVAVAVHDAFGNLVTVDPNSSVTETIRLAFTAGTNTEGATLSGTLTQNILWTSGITIFQGLRVDKVGSYSITASDADLPTNLADESTAQFSVTHGAASQMVIVTQPPGSIQALNQFSVVVEIRDAAGNVVTTDPSGTLTERATTAFASGTNTEGATLGGTLTRNASWSTGRITFDNLTVDRAGNFALTISDASMPTDLTDVTTSAFDVSAPPTSDLTVTSITAPSSGTIGGTIQASATVANTGNQTAGPFRIAFYFSTNNIISTGDTYSGSSCALAGLGAGSSFVCSIQVSVPSSLSPGNYYLGAYADDQFQVSESNEGNNTLAASNQTTLSGGADPCASSALLTVGGSISGSLASTDCNFTSGSNTYYGDWYRFTTSATTTQIAIWVDAPTFEPVLWNYVWRNVDVNATWGWRSGGSGTRVTTVMAVPASGAFDHYVRVTSFTPTTSGSYTVGSQFNPVISACADMLVAKGISVSHTLGTGCDYTANNGQTKASKMYILFLPANTSATVRMNNVSLSNNDPYLECYDVTSSYSTPVFVGGCVDDDSGGNRNSLLTIPTAGTNRFILIRATHFSTAPVSGSYTLSIDP